LIINSKELPQNHLIKSDVCIIGAGAAGITLARECRGQNFQVSLLESGGLEYEEHTQSLYKGENSGHPYYDLDSVRLRYFGGTTNHWMGACRPLDEIDFESRDGFPYSGWPFTRAHLLPYYNRAQKICQLSSFEDYEEEAWDSPQHFRGLSFLTPPLQTIVYQRSPPTRFGQVYREDLESAKNITTYIWANILEIKTDEFANNVTELRAGTLRGNRFSVSAKIFILATGGIENARLLLLSNSVNKVGLGNQHDLVGRFFMEHPEYPSGTLLLTAPQAEMEAYRNVKKNNVRFLRAMTLNAETLQGEKLSNFSIEFRALEDESETDSIGIESFKEIYRTFQKGKIPGDFWTHITNVMRDIDDVAAHAYGKVFQSSSIPTRYRLFSRTEQVPNPESRVVLTEKRDEFGLPRVQLNWQLDVNDKHRMRRAHEIIGKVIGSSGIGRLRVELIDDEKTWPSPLQGGYHNMGTTRMHENPKKGVTDANCKVHGISNLFIAGSSVFPTSGYANPTLTIVPMTLRLGDHIKNLMSKHQ